MEAAYERNWNSCWLGRVDYDSAWGIQEQLANDIVNGAHAPTLLLLEHPHVYTLGRSAQSENILWSEAERAEQGVILRTVDRGGDVTYHGPGQLVGYPLLPLAQPDWNRAGMENAHIPEADSVGFVHDLEKMLIFALARLGIVAGQRPGFPGVWVAADVWSRCPRCIPSLKPKPVKIASIGAKVDANGISRHGFALNVATDPYYWEGIVPYGSGQAQMANISDLLDPAPEMPQVCDAVIAAFEDVFQCHISRDEDCAFSRETSSL